MKFISGTVIPAAVFLGVAACGQAPAPQTADTAAIEAASSEKAGPALVVEAPADPITGKVWTLSPEDGRQAVIRVFLADGALLQDSCFETFRLSQWRRISADRIAWNEDGMEIEADIVVLDDETLTLSLNLGSEEKTETYRIADVPYVCPDRPR